MSKTINKEVYTEAVKIYRKVYKNKPLDESAIKNIMARIESKRNKKPTMDESIDKFLEGKKFSARQFLKEFEVADDYDPSSNGVPDFAGQSSNTPFENAPEVGNDDFKDEQAIPETNPDVDTDISSQLIAERKNRKSEGFYRRNEDAETNVDSLINGNYVTPNEYDFVDDFTYDEDIDKAIDDLNIVEGEEEISYDTPLTYNDSIDAPIINEPIFDNPIVDPIIDAPFVDPYADLDYEDYIITDDYLFEDAEKDEDEDEEEGKGVVAEGKKKTVKEDDEEKKDDEKDAEDKEKKDAKDDDEKKEEKCKK